MNSFIDKRSFDKNIVIAILAGGIGIMLYDVLQVSYRYWFTNTLSFEDYNKEVNPKIFAGIIVMLFAVIYAVIVKFSRKSKSS